MFNIKMTTKKGFGKTAQNLLKLETVARKDMVRLGNKTANEMKEIIKINKLRPQAGQPTKLEDAIEVDHLENSPFFIRWGVAKISQLPIYWRAINWGVNPHPALAKVKDGQVKGSFSPGEAKPKPNTREGRMFPGFYTIKDMKPIPAMNYIEKTTTFVNRQFNFLKNVFRRR